MGRLTKEIDSENKYHSPMSTQLMAMFRATFWSASLLSSSEILSLAILLSSLVFLLFFARFLFLSFFVRPVSSSSCRSSSLKLLSSSEASGFDGPSPA